MRFQARVYRDVRSVICWAVAHGTTPELAPVPPPGKPSWRGLSLMMRSGIHAEQQEQFFARAGHERLLGRVAEVEEVAKTYLHLVDQDYTTGTVALVDGGMTLA